MREPPPIPAPEPPPPAAAPPVPAGRLGAFNLGAIAVGAAVDIALSMVLSTVALTFVTMRLAFAGAGGSPEALQQRMTERIASLDWMLAMSAVGLLFTVAGGYVAARLARVEPVRHGLWTGVASSVLAVLIGLLGRQHSPAWLQASGFAASVPAGALGGLLARARRR